MASPYEDVATALKTLVDAEFEDEGYISVHDKLHESLGHRRTEIGISPIREDPMSGNMTTSQHRILVQFYDLWDKQINPEQQVNPFRITGYAERFKRAVQTQQNDYAGSNEVWYFDIESITFADDPTGNKTRFEAIVRAYGVNTGLVETSG